MFRRNVKRHRCGVKRHGYRHGQLASAASGHFGRVGELCEQRRGQPCRHFAVVQSIVVLARLRLGVAFPQDPVRSLVADAHVEPRRHDGLLRLGQIDVERHRRIVAAVRHAHFHRARNRLLLRFFGHDDHVADADLRDLAAVCAVHRGVVAKPGELVHDRCLIDRKLPFRLRAGCRRDGDGAFAEQRCGIGGTERLDLDLARRLGRAPPAAIAQALVHHRPATVPSTGPARESLGKSRCRQRKRNDGASKQLGVHSYSFPQGLMPTRSRV
ncbi:hypothetical protein Saro_3276 [Novosphingobium aromaticivorans DSM 12444]|uniref:Uncharacterized protein n=1 Tax=Novosphingobium aromaticivorans (strain ATCC 700278 / DSM 12444 / CCUG 56034 / CIP 105152 / NBRC 16084 / F199) TaxID=279238 RepID=Q2G362_NOVAD|nr:hypothetical protein Saro_3276 [Novosphingobium aromaticivorans DSM 12444]